MRKQQGRLALVATLVIILTQASAGLAQSCDSKCRAEGTSSSYSTQQRSCRERFTGAGLQSCLKQASDSYNACMRSCTSKK
jgi:hypothetical protein